MKHLLCLFALLHCLSLPGDEEKPPGKRPNILLLFADDLAWDALACNGNPVVKTPHLDRLASQGCNFTHCYNMGSWSAAVCVPSRTMLNTGRFVWRAGALDLKAEAAAGRTWGQILDQAGYATYMTGKWHVDGLAPQACFRQLGTVRGGMPGSRPDAYQRPRPAGQESWTPWDESLKGYWEGGKHWSVVTADEAIAYLDSRRDEPRPFFAYVAFNAPHDPRQAPKSFVDMYPAAAVDLPRNFLPEAPHADKIGCGQDLRDERLCVFPRTPGAVRQLRGEYYALISHLDQQIGRILDRLDATGLAKDTLVIFSADHGLACGHHGLMGKQNLYEHSLRTAFLLRGPGIPAGRRIATPIYLQDAFPTSLEAAGIPAPPFVEFKSLLPLLRPQPPPHHAAIYGCYSRDLQRCVIDQGWKLIHYPKAGVSMLFDLARDPDELRDLAAEPAQAERLAVLRRRLAELESEMGDPLVKKDAPPTRRDAGH
ncbi:MAG: hypothetical protein RL095_839 [Verrucomicrobiota bacterium]|jgi:choline-sulfatase